MDGRGYFIIDGSYLFYSIRTLQTKRPEYAGKKLNIGQLTEALTRVWSISMGKQVVRAVYYFRQGDLRIEGNKNTEPELEIPPEDEPGQKDRWQIKKCGQSLRTIPEEEIQKLSEEYREFYPRAEKGLDIRLTCDILTLVARGAATNIVFMVNDSDYIPLFETIQQLGANTYLTSLYSALKINKDLPPLADRYLTLDQELDTIFGITPPTAQPIQLEDPPSDSENDT